ncbi:MAG: hypothetical protein R2755_04730 [Acidimicrobiales bacterium]
METRRDRHGPADRRRTPLAALALTPAACSSPAASDDATPLETAATAGVPRHRHRRRGALQDTTVAPPPRRRP